MDRAKSWYTLVLQNYLQLTKRPFDLVNLFAALIFCACAGFSQTLLAQCALEFDLFLIKSFSNSDISEVGKDISDRSGQYNLGVYDVSLRGVQSPLVLKLEPESIFAKFGATSIHIQNKLAEIDLAPKVLGYIPHKEIGLRKRSEFKSELFVLQTREEPEFVGIIMEKLPAGWNTKASNELYSKNSWMRSLNWSDIEAQMQKIETYFIANKINPRGDLQFYITKAGKVWVIDFMTYKIESDFSKSSEISDRFKKVKDLIRERLAN